VLRVTLKKRPMIVGMFDVCLARIRCFNGNRFPIITDCNPCSYETNNGYVSHLGMVFAFLFGDMKINLIPTRKLALLCTVLAGALLTFSHNARALSIGDNHELGFIVAGNVGDANRLLFVNHLIGMSEGSSGTFMNNFFTRSNNHFASLPTAVVGAGTVTTPNPPSVVSINIGSGLYSYLYAKYDGPNAGTEVWYIGDLSGIITIPGFLGRYGLSGYTLFGPGVPGVPDGGTTAMLLGAALSVLGVARRYVMS